MKLDPILVFYFCVYLLSLSGLPFFLGFFFKFFIYFVMLSNYFIFLYFFISFFYVLSFFYSIRMLRLVLFDINLRFIGIVKKVGNPRIFFEDN